MTTPYIPPDPPVHTNPRLQAFIKSRVQQKLREMGAQVDDNYVNQAVQHYSQAGSPLVNEFYKLEENTAKRAATEAMPGSGSMGDVVERTARDVGVGAVQGITSPARFLLKHTGHGDLAKNMEDVLNYESADQQMGGKGLSSNPILGTLQESVEPGTEMYTNAKMLGNKAYEGVGNFLGNVARRLPQSRVLQALAPKAGAGVVQNLLPEAAKGMGGAAISMPDETFQGKGEGLGYGAAMGALGALSHASVARPDATGTPGVNPIRSAWQGLNGLFEPPTQRPGQLTPAPETAPPAPPAQPIAASPVAPSAPPVPETPQAGPTSKGFGGDPVDWGTVDAETRAKVDAAFSGAKTIQDRAKLLGVEGPALGAGGSKLDTRVVENLQQAQKPEDLLGYLQRGLLRGSGGKVPRGTKAVPTATTGAPEATASVPPTAPPAGPDVADVANLKTKLGDVNSTERTIQPPSTAGLDKVIADLTAKQPRKGKLKRQDVLSAAPRMDDGTLDWDKLDPTQRESVAGMLGKDYRGKIVNMNLGNIQKVLNNNQFDSFLKALKRQPRATNATPADATATPTPTEAPVVPVTAGSPGGTSVPVTPAQEATSAPTAPPEGATQPAAETPKVQSPGAWDALPLAKKLLHLQKRGLSDPAMAEQPWESLPAPLRARLQSDPAVQADLTTARVEGGAPLKGAGFRAEDPGSGLVAGRTIKRKPKPAKQ